jgi:hypothetical protein
MCPLCLVNVQVPLVRTALLKGPKQDPATHVSRQLPRIQRVDGTVKSLTASFQSLLRRVPGQEADIRRLEESARVIRERLDLITRRLRDSSAQPLVPPPPVTSSAFWSTSSPSATLWKRLTLVCGGLAVLFALLAVSIR